MKETSQEVNLPLKLNLLIISQDPSFSQSIKKSEIGQKCNIYFWPSKENIINGVEAHNIDAVIIDTKKSTEEAEPIFNSLKSFDPLLDVVICGQPIPTEKVMELINKGVSDYIVKPMSIDNLVQALTRISKKKNLRRETYNLEKKLEKKYYFYGMIGKNPHMLEIFSLIENIANYFSCVLITGETGTGKEMVARAIRELSHTHNKKLVICDCVSIPENLFESELFGYMKGAFTGADKNKKGLFQEADGGIIFLDEIGEIPLSIQAKLLRVLEHHHFRPLGSNQNQKVTVKVIAATSRNLRECIKKGTFREDLFHRLNKVEIHLPPLRERPEDMPLLVRYFLNRFNHHFDKQIKGISRRVQKLFLQYKWPGNVRELENVLERASMLCAKEFIDLQDLPPYLQEFSPAVDEIPFIDRKQLATLDELEKEYINYLLKITKNNLRKTAKILNISRTTLYNKLKKYNISH